MRLVAGGSSDSLPAQPTGNNDRRVKRAHPRLGATNKRYRTVALNASAASGDLLQGFRWWRYARDIVGSCGFPWALDNG